MSKYLNEKNINFVAQVATTIEAFNLMTAVNLCIDEWYLGNPIFERWNFDSAAKKEFKQRLFGDSHNVFDNKRHSVIMTLCLLEFFDEYIGPKYIEIQKYVYDYMEKLKENDPYSIFQAGTDFEYFDFKFPHSEVLLDEIRDVITDWNFGFGVNLDDTSEFDGNA